LKSFEEQVSVKIIGITKPVVDFIPDSEGIVSYSARVSSPHNQDNFDTAAGLLRYCARNGHWSVFEMCNAVIEIKAPRDISRQILRHKSAAFQEFSQRYAEVTEDMFVWREARLQDDKNRQNSFDTEDAELQQWWIATQEEVIDMVTKKYQEARKKGIAKECARVILPEGNTMSSLYMNGTLRTWIHYATLRDGNGTQKEHIVVANKVKEELTKLFPNVMEISNKI